MLDLSLSNSNPRLNVKCFVLCEIFCGGGYISAQHRTQPGLAGTYVLFQIENYYTLTRVLCWQHICNITYLSQTKTKKHTSERGY